MASKSTITSETLNELNRPWIKIGIRPNTSPYICGRTEMYLIEHSSNYRGCVANHRCGAHYDLGFLNIDSKDGILIIING